MLRKVGQVVQVVPIVLAVFVCIVGSWVVKGLDYLLLSYLRLISNFEGCFVCVT